MNSSETIACLKKGAERGDVSAFCPLADELLDNGHLHGEEFAELAVTITTETDWTIVTMAIAVFLKLLEEN